MKRIIVFSVLAALAVIACQDSATDPLVQSLTPSFSLTAGDICAPTAQTHDLPPNVVPP